MEQVSTSKEEQLYKEILKRSIELLRSQSQLDIIMMIAKEGLFMFDNIDRFAEEIAGILHNAEKFLNEDAKKELTKTEYIICSSNLKSFVEEMLDREFSIDDVKIELGVEIANTFVLKGSASIEDMGTTCIFRIYPYVNKEKMKKSELNKFKQLKSEVENVLNVIKALAEKLAQREIEKEKELEEEYEEEEE